MADQCGEPRKCVRMVIMQQLCSCRLTAMDPVWKRVGNRAERQTSSHP